MIDIRPAAERDIGALCELYRDFHEFQVRGVPTRLATLRDVWHDERARLAGRLREVI